MPLSLRFAIPLGLLFFALLSGIVGIAVNLPRIDKEAEKQGQMALSNELNRLQGAFRYLLRHKQLEDYAGYTGIEREIAALSSLREYRTIILTRLDTLHKVELASKKAWEKLEATQVYPLFDRHTANRAARLKQIQIVRRDNALLGYVGLPVSVDRHTLRNDYNRVLFVHYDLQPAKRTIRAVMLFQALWSFITQMGLALVLWFMFDFFLTRRAARLVASSQALAKGLLSARSDLRGRDELAQIGKAFDLMAMRIERTQKQLAELNQQNELILSSAGDGIYGIDLDGKVKFANPAALKMLGHKRSQLLHSRLHLIIHHSYADGKPYPEAECEVCYPAGHEVFSDKEVFWRTDGSCFPVEYLSRPMHNDDGELEGAVVIFRDISLRRETEKRMRHMATHDNLTGLPNRSLFMDLVSNGIDMAHKKLSSLAVMFIDLDGFKAVNDTLGHDAGDALLKQVAQRLSECVRRSDTVARLGGDEFVILLMDVGGKEPTAQVAQKILDELTRIFVLPGEQQARIGGSIGIALYPEHGDNAEILLKASDQAMYRIKHSGKNNYIFADDRSEGGVPS